MTYELQNITPRQYQEATHSWAIERDEAVICLPTGTGKTLIGCMWACQRLSSRSVNRILILEPSRFLVEQTASYYEEYTTIPAEKLDGSTPPNQRKNRWGKGGVVVTTPQTAVNDCERLNFDAVIVDECHHTTGKHAFAQLLKTVTFPYKLGLSATIPASKESEIQAALGPIRRRSWTDLPDEHVPDWLGEIYDTPYPFAYQAVVDELEKARLEYEGSRLAGLPTLGIRMLCRDGAIALEETLTNSTTMGELLYDRVASKLANCPPLHKLKACRQALSEHEFEKAVIFVDRVTIATRLAEELSGFSTVTLLGRLHTSRREQQEAVSAAKSDSTDLIIATAAGEEGIDLPAADLLVVWSNVVSSVRFIQRLGRIMRPSESNSPRTAIYLATPDSPDYESLRRGLSEAQRAGLDIAHIDTDTILSRSIVTRVQDVLESTPRQPSAISDILGHPETKVDGWLRTNVRDGNVFYLYSVPDDLNEWRQAAKGIQKWLGIDTEDGDVDQPRENKAADSIRNNFSPTKEHRYYLLESDVDLIQSEFPSLFNGNGTHRLSADFGPSYNDRAAHSAYVTPEMGSKAILEPLGDCERFYATLSYDSNSPSFSFQMLYQGSTDETVISAILRNADAIATTLEQRLN